MPIFPAALVRFMSEFKTAADLDNNFDYAGPERSLGLLYRDAPAWRMGTARASGKTSDATCDQQRRSKTLLNGLSDSCCSPHLVGSFRFDSDPARLAYVNREQGSHNVSALAHHRPIDNSSEDDKHVSHKL